MTRQQLAAELAARVAGTLATDTMMSRLAADDTLMDLAASDMDAAARMLVDLAFDTLNAYVAIKRDTMKKEAA